MLFASASSFQLCTFPFSSFSYSFFQSYLLIQYEIRIDSCFTAGVFKSNSDKQQTIPDLFVLFSDGLDMLTTSSPEPLLYLDGDEVKALGTRLICRSRINFFTMFSYDRVNIRMSNSRKIGLASVFYLKILMAP